MLRYSAALASATAQPVATTGFGTEWGRRSPLQPPRHCGTFNEFASMGSASAPLAVQFTANAPDTDGDATGTAPQQESVVRSEGHEVAHSK